MFGTEQTVFGTMFRANTAADRQKLQTAERKQKKNEEKEKENPHGSVRTDGWDFGRS